ncbi:TM2 domain-containing protein [Massilia sp. Dwa41.01b]|uniref:NINE protein n=1 Tax=unclassified Massilia TaxID=2609279 RepID=UPI001601DCD2|nr:MULTISPECIES: NINE protein [unclassified Massilia]QNA88332.1 TM2 domain-containing protein [Massilia sp. Dwa41.01b]QNA99231.1 TM2 domain-containing protein [Massilia sp. Se16.2.3]
MAHKNKTFATALALLLGTVGAHRFYLHGGVDRLGLLHVSSIPISGLIFSNVDGAHPFYALLPLLVSCIAGCIAALAIGLTPDDKWDARFNAAGGSHSRSNWILALLLVATLMVGATVLIATIARTFDLMYTGGAYG